MFEELLKKYMQPIIEDAYKQGAEDTIRRFAFVYDVVRQNAIEDVYAEAGAIDIEEVDEELSLDVFDDMFKEAMEPLEKLGVRA